MANDRFYIICDGCKEYRWLNDWHPGSPLNLSEDGRKWLNDFFENHWDCAGGEFEDNVGFSFGNEKTVLQAGYTEHKYIENDTVEISCMKCRIALKIPKCDKPDSSKKVYCTECLQLEQEKKKNE